MIERAVLVKKLRNLTSGISFRETDAIDDLQVQNSDFLSNLPTDITCNWQHGECNQMREYDVPINCCSSTRHSKCKFQTDTGCTAEDERPYLCQVFLCGSAKHALQKHSSHTFEQYKEIYNKASDLGVRGAMVKQWKMNQEPVEKS